MKDKRNHHGTVGKEQQFRKSAAITFVVWNFWSHTPSAGWQADEIQVILKFL